ncbi:hypothetical protein A3G63_03365 [Candidatus Kaiserbacteria bacterium RIFCSPLOWO2_12_FULL_52_8]|uniref:Uncharacterized protein n=1 Tax=Candidatus Kaiserbacteria bacterium RIFCSPHIGHO2_01_FULL_53_31 TaxID=1798481 RepID=A0A1F6CH75_9BACT|nr:MAG: hypothetical protein A2678_03555 [Candidatus Kaiserbacteria bacterium RIFCSPHIGHO2_01_FULL_53_31]OGG92537.1 MAG: hypothetical protein A3G63_03365 [Candidatus Kaiserbacteria bacterium RIFCSPLOWO2_12_FULL_52_8]
MDPEIKRQLEEIHALSKDNHRMLRAIRRYQWASFFARIIIWTIVLLLPLYLYQQYLYPIVSKFSAASTTTTSNLFGLPTSVDIQKLINSYKAGQQ